MSFASDMKTELCALEVNDDAHIHALCYGMTLFARRFSANEISFTVAHEPTAKLYKEYLSKHFGIDVSVKCLERKRGTLYNVSVDLSGDRLKLFDIFSHQPSAIRQRINRANIEDDECIPFFLRGAFLVCGALSDPSKDYHIEFDVGALNLSKDLAALIEEYLVAPKMTLRRGSHIVYYKESEHIEDILTFIGATNSTFEIMEAKIIKDFRNRANRRTNCETANIDKTVAASTEQIEDINFIFDKCGEDYLSNDLKTIALLRLNNPELSLRELGDLTSPPLSRSGINHRMRRISEIANKLRQS